MKDKDIDVKWRPLDDECEYGDEVEYDDGEEDWIPFEDFIGKCYEEVEYGDGEYDD